MRHQLIMHVHSQWLFKDTFRPEQSKSPLFHNEEACYWPLSLSFHKVTAIHFKKQQWSSDSLQPVLFLCDSPSLLLVCQSF